MAPQRAQFRDRVSSLVEHYFSNPERTLELNDGDILLKEGELNYRLYYVRSGQLVGHSEGDGDTPEAFLMAGPGEFVGLRSFSAPDTASVMTVKSQGKSTVCFASLEDIGSEDEMTPEQVLLPVFIQAMLSRQKLAYRMKEQEQETERRLREMQEMSQLGQFAAGVAHELNNAISVIDRGSEWLANALESQVKQCASPEELAVFQQGLHEGRTVTSRDARKNAKAIRKEYGLSDAAARRLSPLGLNSEFLAPLRKELEQTSKRLHELWELGATFRDLTIAAEQAASVVESMKHLGGGPMPGAAATDVFQTLRLAMTIMRSQMSGLEVELDLPPSPAVVRINKGELVQIWVNLIHNSCDAIFHQENKRASERDKISIHATISGPNVIVSLKDTGPGIPPQLLSTIFQPNFTTKKSGLSFGLGIGLSIVRRIVSSAGGTIVASNWEQGASMVVTLPLSSPSIPPPPPTTAQEGQKP